jgi:uncharacterized phage protein (TIGR02218 family)
MKSISSQFAGRLVEAAQTLAFCIDITRRDGTVFAFTSHDVDIVFNAITYRTRAGFSPEKLSSTTKLQDDSMQLLGVLADDAMTESDVRAGLFDGAAVQCFLVDPEAVSAGKLTLRVGVLGAITIEDGVIRATVNGLVDQLQRPVCSLFSPECRANLGDAKCGVNLSGFTFSGTLTSVTNAFSFQDTTRSEAAGYFTYGLIRFPTSATPLQRYEIQSYEAGGRFHMALGLPFLPTVALPYEVIAGCDKQFVTCRNRFQNAINFRGEPHVPTYDQVLATSSTRLPR